MTQTVDEPRIGGALTEAASAKIGASLGDAPWMQKLRARAAQAATTLSMPTPVERPWKYLDMSALSLDHYEPAIGSRREESAAEIRARYAIPSETSDVVVFEDSTPTLVEGQGRMLVPFADAADEEQELLEKLLASVVPVERTKLTALHYAFLAGGLLVHVPANHESDQPLRITRSFIASGQLATPHTLIVTGANSRVRIVEDFRSTDDDMVAIPVVEILPGAGSRVEYTSLHRWGNQTRVFKEQRTVTSRDSEVLSVTLATGAQVLKYHIEGALEGRGSSSDILGLTVGNGTQHHNFYTLQNHIAEDTRSDLMIKSALEGASRAVYYGVTRVGLKARRADANQENRNLLLSKQAKADSDPVLEILTNDVLKCAHGATAGPVNEEQLYYLQTRGIDRAAAEDLLVWGFLSQVLDRVPGEQLREEIAASLEAKLKEGA
jgi:Fe-S cluster assembly protein SufD